MEDVVSDGMSALRLIEDKHFEVLFMDVNLSGAPDGIETARRIRQRADTPIIFVTAYSFSDSIYNDVRRIDSSLVVGKPITRGAVTDALRKLGLSRATASALTYRARGDRATAYTIVGNGVSS